MQICRKIRVQNNKNNDKKKNVNKCTKNQTYLINNNTHYEHKTIVSIEEHQNKNIIITNYYKWLNKKENQRKSNFQQNIGGISI